MTPYVELSSDGLATIHAPGATDGVTPGTYVAQAGIEGWESAPDLKTDSTERQTGDGTHDVSVSEIRYSSRTLTCHLVCRGASRADVMARVLALKALCHRRVRVRVVDGGLDRWCDGRCRPESVATWSGRTCAVTLTVVCDRPALLSTTPSIGTMVPATGDGGGLVFDAVASGSDTLRVLHWPLSFGAGALRSGNVCTLHNSGTIPADVVITAAGDMPGGIAVTDTSTGRQLAYGQEVTWSGLTMDSRTRTATVQGVDVSRSLTARGFPTVPAGGSITLSLQASGTGTVTATCHDTYI